MSAQTKNSKRKASWIAAVRERSETMMGDQFPLSCPVAVGVTYFYDVDVWSEKPGERLDVDNCLKPIVDGLLPGVIVDDQLVRDVSGSRRPLDPSLRLLNPSEALVEGLAWGEAFVLVRIGLPVNEEEILWIGV
ncbi:RusA family crossover junction endodeoxyribonuclease [Micromonospora sp. DT68]|uniref:RusA family crossover junction endodeoxyribonuclease n=1 Tax=Micromonospora TaxID=1873 RepID=UPI003CE88DA4